MPSKSSLTDTCSVEVPSAHRRPRCQVGLGELRAEPVVVDRAGRTPWCCTGSLQEMDVLVVNDERHSEAYTGLLQRGLNPASPGGQKGELCKCRD